MSSSVQLPTYKESLAIAVAFVAIWHIHQILSLVFSSSSSMACFIISSASPIRWYDVSVFISYTSLVMNRYSSWPYLCLDNTMRARLGQLTSDLDYSCSMGCRHRNPSSGIRFLPILPFSCLFIILTYFFFLSCLSFFLFFLSFVRHVYCVQRPFPIRFRANGVSIIFFYWASSYRGTVGGCYVVRDYEMNLVTFENIERSNDAFSSMLLLVGSESSLLHQETWYGWRTVVAFWVELKWETHRLDPRWAPPPLHTVEHKTLIEMVSWASLAVIVTSQSRRRRETQPDTHTITPLLVYTIVLRRISGWTRVCYAVLPILLMELFWFRRGKLRVDR